MMGALSRFLAGLVFLAAPLLSCAQVVPAECVRQGGGACTEWKVHVANGYSPTEEHAYLSWTPDEWLAGLASCRAAPGTSISSGWLWTKKTTEVTGGLCGRLFAINNLCNSSAAGEASKVQCVKWGLSTLKRPGWISVAIDQFDGVQACTSIIQSIGGSIAPGNVYFTPPELPTFAPVTKKSLKQLEEALQALKDATKATGSKEKGRKYLEAVKALKEVKGQYDDAMENINKVTSFVELVSDVGIRSLFLQFAGVAGNDPACLDALTNGNLGACDLKKGAVEKAQKVNKYMNELDSVKCFKAAGDIAAAMRRE